jgi:simple sugar transport system permease protein
MNNSSSNKRVIDADVVSTKDKIFNFFYKYGTLLAIILAMFFFSTQTPYFFTVTNIGDVLRSVCVVTLMAIGVTFSATVDGFDVSVGSITGLTTLVCAACMIWWEMPVWLSILIPSIIGIIIGLWNAFLIEKIRIPDILATLSTLFVIQGLLYTFTKGYSIYANMPLDDGTLAPGRIDPGFLRVGQGSVLGIPNPVLIVTAIMIVSHIFLNYTKHGRFLYMTGGNREAARLSGVPVVQYRVFSYALSGFFAALGGVLLVSRVGSGEINAGAALLMDSIAACYIGFSVLGQGKPNIIGTFAGAVLMGILLNGLTMMNVPYYAQDFVKGAVLVLALSLTYGTKKES